MTTQMKFLNAWTIDLSTIPKYPEFEKPFKEPLNRALIKHMATPAYDWDLGYKKYADESRTTFVNQISNKIKGDTLTVAHKHPFNLGRYYPAESSSICSQPTYMKHTCMEHCGWKDIDMKKGHPTLLCEIGRINKFAFPAVKRYVDNADAVFDEMEEFYGKGVLQKGQKKWFYNLIIYGGGSKTWYDGLEQGDGSYKGVPIKRELTPFMKEYQTECKMFGDIIFKHNQNIYNLVKDIKKKDWENKNRVVSYFLQTIENHILYNTYKLLVKEGIMEKQVGALEFDGLCFPPKRGFDETEVVDLLNTQTLIKTGIGIKWAFKPYEEVDKQLLNMDWDKFEPDSNDGDGNVVVDDTDAGEKVYNELKSRLVFSQGRLYYKDDRSLWITDDAVIISKIRCYVMGKRFVKLNEKDKQSPYSGIRSNVVNCSNIVIDIVKQNGNDNWLDNWTKSSIGKMLFNNGYYDYDKKLFIKRGDNSFDETIIFNSIAGYDFERCEDTEYMEYVNNAMFNDALGVEVGQYFKQKFAYALAGRRTKQASALFGIGNANAGKSLIGKALSKCAGDYVGSFNGNNLQTKKMSSGDDAQSLRWVMLIKEKRIIISQEMGMENKINGEIIKKLTGGDSIIARGHGGNETEFDFNGLVVAYCNDAPKIAPFDDAGKIRVRVIPYEISFTENPEGEFEKEIDLTLNDAVKTDKFANALMTLLIDSYYLDYIKDDIEVTTKTASAQFQSDTGGIMDTILAIYEFTGDKEHFVMSDELNRLFDGTQISSAKVGREMNQYCKKKNITGIESKMKKIGGKAIRAWRGMRERLENPEDDSEDEE